ncbi:MAG: hypothetical protein LRY50_07580 [Geovibrio sp.]|nr:hypothetical protein [Geovibrio sp.]
MIEKLIEYSARNKFVIILLTLIITGWGVWSVNEDPAGCIPRFERCSGYNLHRVDRQKP